MINKNYAKLEENYLFTEIARRTSEFIKANPDKPIIKLGIGDVTRPLAPMIADAVINAMEELKHAETFRGYGPELGYKFAREAVQRYYKNYNIDLDLDEITIGDGIGEDIANITDIFEKGSTFFEKLASASAVEIIEKAKGAKSANELLELAKAEGIIPAPESCHAIAATVREALKCKETGESKVILFNLSGHGLIDMAAYDQFLAGNIQ